MVRLWIVVAIAMVLAACGGDELGAITEEVCEDLDGARVFEAGPIIDDAVDAAEEAGSSGPELGERMREECPGVMAGLDELSEESDREEALEDQVEMTEINCRTDGATGTVRNHSDSVVEIWVEVDFLDEDDVVLDQSIDNIRRLSAGQGGNFEVNYLGDDRPARCSGRVDSVRPK